MRVALVCMLAFTFAGTAFAGLIGTVVNVSDGDSVTVLVRNHTLDVTLGGIDAPDIGLPFGADAWQSLAGVCDGKPVYIDELVLDRERRITAKVVCAGIDASAEQVRLGHARVEGHSSRFTTPGLQQLQAAARAANLGIWQAGAASGSTPEVGRRKAH